MNNFNQTSWDCRHTSGADLGTKKNFEKKFVFEFETFFRFSSFFESQQVSDYFGGCYKAKAMELLHILAKGLNCIIRLTLVIYNGFNSCPDRYSRIIFFVYFETYALRFSLIVVW